MVKYFLYRFVFYEEKIDLYLCENCTFRTKKCIFKEIIAIFKKKKGIFKKIVKKCYIHV